MKWMMRVVGALVCASMMMACQPQGGAQDAGQAPAADAGNGDGGTGGPPDAGEPTDGGEQVGVSGLVRSRYVTAAGVTEVRRDLTAATLEAWEVDAQSGELRSHPVTKKADGTFSIPDMPEGATYSLRLDANVYVTSARQLDLTDDVLGRADAVEAGEGTELALDLEGLQDWQDGDDLMMVAPNAGLDYYSLSYMGGVLDVAEDEPAVAAGATEALLTLDYPWATGSNLVEAAKGDSLYLVQLSQQDAPEGTEVMGASRAATVTDLTMHDAQTNTVLATMQPLAQSSHVFDFRLSEFQALVAQSFPDGEVPMADIYVDVLPYGAQYGEFAGATDIARMYGEDLTEDLSVTLSFGDPFPEAWQRRVTAVGSIYHRTAFSVGAQELERWDVPVVQATVSLDKAGEPLRPQVGPVRALKLNGQDALAGRTGVGTSPTVSWSAPSVGTAHRYGVMVYRLSPSPDDATYLDRTRVAALYTQGTRVTLPPGILTAGERYVLVVRAYYEPGLEAWQSAPRKAAPVPEGMAELYSAAFQP